MLNSLFLSHRTSAKRPCLAIAVALLTVGDGSAVDYYVRERGIDEANGRTRNSAWRSIERVNQARLQPGDRVLFEAGKSFTGNLRLTAEDAGDSSAPVVIGSHGRGRATIRAGVGTGITVENAGGVTIENLIVAGNGRATNSGYGVVCDNQLTTGERLDYLCIQNVEAHGFGRFGIWVTGERSGFSNVRILGCVLRDNLRGGMEVAGRLPYDATNYAHANVLVSRCRAFNNTGDPNRMENHSGSGIVLYQVDGGVMEFCEAWNNGADCRSPTGGGVGLWTCASRRVIIQHCESFANRTSGKDGGGFDLDGGCVECVLQYNYSHDNDGPGLMVYTYAYASHADRGNVVRFNISENDSRKSRTYAGLWLRSDGPRMTGVEIYNNTVTIGPWCDQTAMVHGHEVEAAIRNNIFIARGPAVPLRVSKPHDRIRFENNLYWHEDGAVQIAWENETFTSLGEWRQRTGQEQVLGRQTGVNTLPGLTGHSPSVSPGERVGLPQLRAFLPRPRSPSTVGGMDLRSVFGLDVGARDFSGVPLPDSGGMPLGARVGRSRE